MDDFVILIACVIVPILILWSLSSSRRAKEKRLKDAAEKYQNALRTLEQSPGSTGLRKRTLAAGRTYARLARENGRESLFDEVALMNDINAVAGSAVDTKIPKKPADVAPVEQRLQRLHDLKKKGLITEREYQEKRAKILDEI